MPPLRCHRALLRHAYAVEEKLRPHANSWGFRKDEAWNSDLQAFRAQAVLKVTYDVGQSGAIQLHPKFIDYMSPFESDSFDSDNQSDPFGTSVDLMTAARILMNMPNDV